MPGEHPTAHEALPTPTPIRYAAPRPERDQTMQGNERQWTPEAREWGLDKMNERELLATHMAFDLWRNPSNATLKLRNAVVFRPRSNCARVKSNFWFMLAVSYSRRIIDQKYRPGYSRSPLWYLSEYEIEQLGMAKLFCDWDHLESIVNLLFPAKAETIIEWENGRTIKDVVGTDQFREMVAEYEEKLPRDTYMMNDQDTGTDIIETLRGRIRDPATPARDVAALTKELTKREADRRRLFPHLWC